MHRFRSLALCLALVVAAPTLVVANSVYLEQNGFAYFLSTERDTYATYEYVPVHFSVTNISGDTINYISPCSFVYTCVMVWDPLEPINPWHPEPVVVWGSGCFCDDELSQQSIGPGESYVRDSSWDMYNINTGTLIRRTGTHTLEASFSAYDYEYNPLGCDLTLEFEVVPVAASAPEPVPSWGAIKALYR